MIPFFEDDSGEEILSNKFRDCNCYLCFPAKVKDLVSLFLFERKKRLESKEKVPTFSYSVTIGSLYKVQNVDNVEQGTELN